MLAAKQLRPSLLTAAAELLEAASPDDVEIFEGKAKVCKLNIDEAQEIAAKYGIMNIPTVILFKDGKPVNQKVGMGNKSQYEEMINAAL